MDNSLSILARDAAFARSEDAVGAKSEGSLCRGDRCFGAETEPLDERRPCVRSEREGGTPSGISRC